MSLRLLTEADAPAFRDIRQRSLTDHPDIFTSTAEEWGLDLATYVDRIRVNRVFGVFVDGVLVGNTTLALTARNKTKQRHKCEIHSVYVAPEARGQGLSRALMLAAIAEARRLGFEAIVLGVATHNVGARRLYESLGFVVFGVEPRYLKLADGRYVDEAMMQLDLG